MASGSRASFSYSSGMGSRGCFQPGRRRVSGAFQVRWRESVLRRVASELHPRDDPIGDSVEPAREGFLVANRVGPASQNQNRYLKSIVGFVCIAEERPAEGSRHRPVRHDENLKGPIGFVASLKLLQELAVAQYTEPAGPEQRVNVPRTSVACTPPYECLASVASLMRTVILSNSAELPARQRQFFGGFVQSHSPKGTARRPLFIGGVRRHPVGWTVSMTLWNIPGKNLGRDATAVTTRRRTAWIG